MLNQLYCEDNVVTMGRMIDNDLKVDGIITSPPYNVATKRKDCYYDNGYAEIDNLTPTQYIATRMFEFEQFAKIVSEKGVVLYNLSYTKEFPSLPQRLVAGIDIYTPWKLKDVIYWKKKTCVPFQTSPNRLSRIVEPIYVFAMCDDYIANKEIAKINEKTNQTFYKIYWNYIEAANNDGFQSKLKACYSTELVTQLIDMYFQKGSTIYDPFMGIGTTALGCKVKGCNYIGSEIKEEFHVQALDRIQNYDLMLTK